MFNYLPVCRRARFCRSFVNLFDVCGPLCKFEQADRAEKAAVAHDGHHANCIPDSGQRITIDDDQFHGHDSATTETTT